MLIKEQNAIRKVWTRDINKIALMYPNTYRVAMTSLGIQLLYFLFNSWENFLCERVFRPLDPNIPPYSLENQKMLKDFDIIMISCQFEDDYVNSINLLLKAGINPDVRKRNRNDPIIIIGGPSVTANPFPILFLADAFFLGDVEPISNSLMEALERSSKEERIEALYSIPGFMIYGYHYNSEGEWTGSDISPVQIKNFSNSFYPIQQIIPEDVKGTKNEPIFGRAFYLETDRGCSERCAFCLTGHCRFPRKGRNYNDLIEIFNKAKEVNEFDKVVMYGSASAQSSSLPKLINYISDFGYEVSCSSFRADFLNEELLNSLKRSKQRTITIAPETGDESLRFALHKRMNNKDILDSIKLAWEKGFRHLKVYMMYGFPFTKEPTDESNYSFLTHLREKYFTSGKISISINQFITKANTPLQYAPMLGLKESNSLQKWYTKQIYKIKNVELSLFGSEWAIIQKFLSLRNHKHFPLIMTLGELGNTLGHWKKSFKAHNLTFDGEALWFYNIDDLLPWDHITRTSSKKDLIEQYVKYQDIVQKR